MGGHGEADALEIAAASILRLRGGAALGPAETFTAKAQHVLKADIAEREIANFADCVGRQDIFEPQLERVTAEFLRGGVHHVFHDERGLRSAPAAVAAGDGRIRAGGGRVIFDILHAVDPRELFEHRAHIVRRDALIAACVELGGQVEGFQNVIFVKFGANFTFDGMTQHSAEDGLAPVELKLDGASRHFCADGGQRFQDHLLLAAERAAHRRFDGAHMAHRHSKQRCNTRAHAKCRLCGRPDGHAVGAGVIVCHGAVRFHGDMRDTLRL